MISKHLCIYQSKQEVYYLKNSRTLSSEKVELYAWTHVYNVLTRKAGCIRYNIYLTLSAVGAALSHNVDIPVQQLQL